MTATPDYKTDIKRDATDSIRGYVYQIYQSIFAWMTLKENERLFLECAEDFDVCSGQSVIGTQVKDLSGSLTLRSPHVVAALNNFWSLQQDNPDHDVALRFLTTAVATHEKGTPFGEQSKGLEYWRLCQSDNEHSEKLRSFLITLPLSSELMDFVQAAPVNDLRTRLINRIVWDLGYKNKDGLQLAIEAKLKLHGANLRINTYHSCQALPHLLKKVADLLSTKGTKVLVLEDFLTEFDIATTESVPKNELEVLRRNSSLQQLINSSDIGEVARLIARSPTIGAPLPVVDGAIRRDSLVTKLEKQFLSSRVLFLHSSSGTGKTNLAALISEKIGGSWGWGGFRGRPVEQVREMLSRAVLEISTSLMPSLLVLDDLDFGHVSHFEREFITLVFTIVQSKGLVIVTGQKPPPLQIFPKLWISQECEQVIPHFDEQEIGELARMHGLYDPEKIAQWQRVIYYSTLGHPQLVHARVRTLSNNGWSATIEDITKSEDIERIRADARSRLVEEFPSEAARTLAYRLSIVSGTFRRNTVVAVAGSPPPISLPGEVFDMLVGPWIEKEGADLYRISPLLMGAANSILSKNEISSVHAKIAHSILEGKELNQYDLASAFSHAFLAKENALLLEMTSQIIQEDAKNMGYLCDPLFWFMDVALKSGQTIIGGTPSTELMLRMLQFKLAAASSSESKALKIINIIEEIMADIPVGKLRHLSVAMAFGNILSCTDVHIPSSTVVRLFNLLMDAFESHELEGIIPSLSENNYPINSNDPIVILFSLQSIRLNGLNDLLELIISLNSLEEKKRKKLLEICDIDDNFSSILINRSWWTDVRAGSLDAQKALEVLQFTESKARKWKARKLYKACLCAISVIHDEYNNSSHEALAVLDVAEKEFKNDAILTNQRAKVLFHAKCYSESLVFFKKALLLPALSNVDYAFSCRDAGVASAKLNEWLESAEYFKKGSEIALQSDVQRNMGIGLIADAAISLWKAGKKKECLLLFANVLDYLPSIETKSDIRIHHLQSTVRHCISWLNFDARKRTDSNFAESLPGMCSNQEPH